MPVRHASRFQPKPAQRHDLAAQQAQQPSDRPHEGFLAAAPAHALGHQLVHLLERFFEDRRQQLRSGFAGDAARKVQFAVLLADGTEFDAAGPGEAESGRRRLAILEGGRDGRPELFLLLFGLGFRHAGD